MRIEGKELFFVPQLGKLASDIGGINSSAPYCRCKKFMIFPYSKRKCGVNIAQVVQRQSIERRCFQRACKVLQRIVFSNSSQSNGKKIDTCPLHQIEKNIHITSHRRKTSHARKQHMGGGSQQNNHPPCVPPLVEEKRAKFLQRGEARESFQKCLPESYLVFPLEMLVSRSRGPLRALGLGTL